MTAGHPRAVVEVLAQARILHRFPDAPEPVPPGRHRGKVVRLSQLRAVPLRAHAGRVDYGLGDPGAGTGSHGLTGPDATAKSTLEWEPLTTVTSSGRSRF